MELTILRLTPSAPEAIRTRLAGSAKPPFGGGVRPLRQSELANTAILPMWRRRAASTVLEEAGNDPVLTEETFHQ